MYPALQQTIDRVLAGARMPKPDRALQLDIIAQWMKQRRDADLPIDLVFICTHNSRRSAFAQVWAAAAAQHLGLKGVHSWSAGAVATAIAEPAINALEKAGFRVEAALPETGLAIPALPHHHVHLDEGSEPLTLFSKAIDDPHNPATGFAAIMVCDEAEQACPFVPNASKRFSLPYLDPKVSDGTPEQERIYAERSDEVAGEMLYLMALAK